MTKLRIRPGVIEQIKADRNLISDAQVGAVLGVTAAAVEAMRHGHQISPAMALQIAAVQGSGFDLTQWVEAIDPATTAA